ncbi:MAG: hypothetical protein ACI9FG_000434 [Crocinitomicaceae bacterium]|jgi:hypothetical protein
MAKNFKTHYYLFCNTKWYYRLLIETGGANLRHRLHSHMGFSYFLHPIWMRVLRITWDAAGI